MKKILSILICLSMIVTSMLVFSACGKQGEENQGSEKTVGSWVLAGNPAITDEFKTVFDKAVSELDGVNYEPVAYLASQVVAGTNHCVLCKATPVTPEGKTVYAVLYIYEDPEGKTTISDIITSNTEIPGTEKESTGGWTEPATPGMTSEAKAALDKACETLTGAEYTPVALLATQVVAGENYRIVCESKPSVPADETEPYFVVVTVYEDLQGNAEITDTTELHP